MNSLHASECIIPLSREAHHHARLFASEQLTLHKGKKVYLNTLAVYAIQTYLKWLDIEADIEQSYTWHPGVRATFDVADLLIPGVGRLECRPIAPDETVISLPGEMAFTSPHEVVGYVAVQFHEKLDSVDLVGFLPAAEVSDNVEQVQLSALKPLETLLEVLTVSVVSESEEVCGQIAEKSFNSFDEFEEKLEEPQAETNLVNLTNWLSDVFKAGWQSAKECIDPQMSNSVNTFVGCTAGQEPETSGIKIIHLNETDTPIILSVALITKSGELEQEVDVLVSARPFSGSNEVNYLPPGLELSLVLNSGELHDQFKTKKKQKSIHLSPLTCEVGFCFSIQITLNGIQLSEYLMV